MTPKYLSAKQVAEMFSISRVTVWRWVRSGRLPTPIKLSPSCSRWRIADLEALERKSAA